ncbi:MAG: F0F1 ATP synthase subunit B [Cytophagales bacterium]|nr:F0F1 ATP synthase subunit B [Armatimonadota bacterium]
MDLLNTLNISPAAIPVNIVGFVLLLLVANKLVFRPIGLVLTERQADISSTYDKIDRDRAEMQALRDDYQARLSGIEAEAREKIQSAIRDAQSARDQIITEANDRSRELVSRAEREAEQERQEAMVTLKKQIVDIALGATAKIIGDGLDESRQRKLIDEFISSGGSVGPSHALVEATPLSVPTPMPAPESAPDAAANGGTGLGTAAAITAAGAIVGAAAVAAATAKPSARRTAKSADKPVETPPASPETTAATTATTATDAPSALGAED